MKFNNCDILLENGYSKGTLIFNDKFENITSKIEEDGLDYSDKLIIPGLFDIHTHGAAGYDFNSAKTLDEMQIILNFYMSHGVTSVLPTLLTDTDEIYFEKLEMIYELSKTNPVIKGIHIEGPFLSKAYKGAQPESCLQPLKIEKFNEYQKHAHGLIKYITISPELDGCEEFVKELVKQGIVVSLGHSGATFDEATVAIKAGAKNFTHVMNAMAPINQHQPSILAAAWYYSDCYNEVICDGIHVHPEMVALIHKIKGGNKMIGITDSLMAAGLPDGNYFIGFTPIYVKNHDCRIVGSDVRAGSTLNAFDGFKNVKRFLNCSDLESSHIWSKNPAELLYLFKNHGSIAINKCADFLVLDKNYILLETYINGKCVYRKESK